MDTLSSEKLQTVARKQASWAIGALRQFSANRCAAMAAGIAFYAAFSLAPTLVMVIAIAGWFFGAEAARGELFREVHGVLGNEAAAGITTIVENAHRSGNAGGIAAIISFAALAIGASATFSSLNSALNMVWPPVGTRSSSVVALVRVRLISFSLVLGVAFLLIVSLVLDTAITFVGQWLWGNSPYVVIGNVLQLIVGLLVLAFAFAALLKFLPDAVVRWQDAMVGGLVAAVLFSAGKKLFALYLAHAGMANSFGAAGSLAVLLMWLYFSAAVLLLGAEFSAARGRLHDPRGAWGMQDSEPPPGSRAKLASVIAASTVAAGAQRRRDLQDSLAADPASALSLPQAVDTDADAPPETPATNGAVRFGRTVVRVENQATRAAAATLVQAGRGAVAADRYVKRHPWGSLLLAAGAALVVTALAGRRNGDSEPPAAANDDR
ncbi:MULTISPECIES: YihY/virulence factor BrkB family protein [Paraburkholderia]|uniref:YihY/virulence factor BrkB family protein n=1 Tax=Paraburkholderia TaxID=1822464 RepID=UPI00225A81F7|nr:MULTISPECIES: YihY/virulence factor BrkB family protein [Paraburkholderia]MCX4162643.1 YihY/virulence factor BrkB family protein [Paraburkholderia megapolitana]MDN7158138.1 YihY/virulence factor BrkB family protein [Paraburkholderia sp. CHISQ3]MDQ6495185.1 YihY/virulence factor BrkB family protein [Paraburkholderia megapolitana]